MIGLNTHIADSTAGVCITPQWCQLLASLGVTSVRVIVQASTENKVRYDLLARAAALYRNAGISVLCVLPVESDAPWIEGVESRVVYPNEELGYQGNRRQNRFIKEFCVRASQIARTLVPLGVTSFCVGNEQNLQGSIAIGANVPPVATDKAPATSPEVWASLCYEAAGYLHVAGAKNVLMGSLSWLPIGTPADIGWHDNTFTARYLSRGLAYLKETGVHTLPFSGICTNSEGRWTAIGAQAMWSAITACFVGAGYAPLPLTIGEWGWQYGTAVNAADATSTAVALAGISSSLYFFTGPVTAEGYGVHGWTVAGSGFVPTSEQTAWWGVLKGLVAQQSPAGVAGGAAST